MIHRQLEHMAINTSNRSVPFQPVEIASFVNLAAPLTHLSKLQEQALRALEIWALPLRLKLWGSRYLLRAQERWDRRSPRAEERTSPSQRPILGVPYNSYSILLFYMAVASMKLKVLELYSSPELLG